MPPRAWTLPPNKLFVPFFLALTFLFLLTSSGRVRTIDEVAVDLQAESLAMHGTTAVPAAQAQGTFYGKFDRSGQPRAPYGAGQAALLVPWHWTARALLAVLPGIPRPARDIFLDAVMVSSSAVFAALAAALSFWIFCRLGIEPRTALWAAAILALATPLFAYSAWFFSEPLTAALLLAAALVLFTGEGDAPSQRLAALAGLFLGFALWVRPTHVLAAPVFLLALLIREPRKNLRAALTLALVVGFFGGAYLLRNQIYFGNPLDFGYPAAAEGGKRLNSFTTPLATGLFGFLFSPGKSVFVFAPPLLLAIPCLWRLKQRNFPLAVIAGVTPLLYLFFFAKYTQWEGGYCIGPRYLLPALALLGLGIGPLLADTKPQLRRLALFLFCAGLLVQVISLGTSFLEDQANGSYYDANWDYRMNYSSVTSQARLLLHYATSSQPARLGLGFDRWFVFLAKVGVSRGLIFAGLLFEFTGLLFFVWRLTKTLSLVPSSEASP